MIRFGKKRSGSATLALRKRWQLKITLCTILLAVLSLMASPRPLHACSPLPAVIQISPRLGVEAPQNATVLLYFPLQWQTRYLDSKNGDRQSMSEAMVTLRAIGAVQPVAVHRSDTHQGIDTVVELRPQQLLQPGDYELSVKVAEQEVVVGQLSVGSVIDQAPPGFRKKPRAQFDNDYRTLFTKHDLDLCGKKCTELPLAWRQSMAVRIGVRPIDLTGNRGDAWETLVTTREVWAPPPKPHGARVFAPFNIRPARKSVARVAPFAKAIARSIALHRWLLAFDECVLTSHFIGTMPESCREVSRQHEVTLRLPYGFPK